MKYIATAFLILCFVGCAKDQGTPSKKTATKAPAKKAAPAKKEAKPAAKKAAPAKPAEVAKKPAATPGVKDDGKVVTVEITGNDMMKYNLSEINIPAGRTVKLTLKHTGKLAANIMGHNFVLLKKGTNVAQFSTKAIAAKATGYIPASDKASVIAHTKVVGGGESTTIEFAAPAAGTYDYICTFPGHSAMMKGKLIVK